MKPVAQNQLKFLSTIFCLFALAYNVQAAGQYFDVNGTTPGYGITNNGIYSFDGPFWATSPGGTSATGFWVPGSFAQFPGGSSGQSYTVTLNNSESMVGLFQSVAGVTLNITAAGSGNFNVVSGVEGFLISGPTAITAPITGVGGVAPEANNSLLPSFYLYGTNTYSGGTYFGNIPNAPLIYFNNNNSFGTGPMTMLVPSGHFWSLLSTGGAPITLPNAFTNTVSGGGLLFAGGTNTPVICTGDWGLGPNNVAISIRNNGNTPPSLTLAGTISGTASVTFSGNNGGGIITLSGTNTYTGGTTVNFTSGGLVIATNGSIMGNMTVTSGSLELDQPAALKSNAILNLVSTLASGAVNLNFSGTQAVNALNINSISQVAGTWGSPASGAQNTSAIFSGTGILNVVGLPILLQQPQSIARFQGQSGSFTVGVAGTAPLTYQWKFNGNNISSATDSSYTIPALAMSDGGTYTCDITNALGGINSLGATLTVLATNCYVNAILADSPISYWRLDETNGTIAYDAVGTNDGKYVNVTLNQPGYLVTEADPSIGLPTSTSARGFVQVTNYTPFAFNGQSPFTLEAWVNFTNVTGVQRIFSTFSPTSPSWGYAFGIAGPTVLRFTTATLQDADQTLTNALVPGLWYHMAVTSDSFAYHFYLNGWEVGTGVSIIGGGNTGTSAPLQLGCNNSNFPGAEQLNGRLDEVAIYNTNLSASQILAHDNCRYSGPPPFLLPPLAIPATNYVSLTTKIQAIAAGQALSYQWFKGSTLLPGQTSDTLVLTDLRLSDAGDYNVQVSNSAGTNTSPSVTITVLPIPTIASPLNLTNGLVLYLPFDGDYRDISGHLNNGTNVGATTFVSPGAIGASALHYYTDTGAGSTNYVTLGVRPDLQFSSNVDFTVAFWVRQPVGSTFTNLPFFTDAVGSTSSGGFAFAPFAGTGGGGWMWTVGTVTSPNVATTFPDANLINDGNWHHLVHVASRTGNCTTYLDGIEMDSQSIVVVGNINTAFAATIGQDPTGAYPVTAQADIDDLAVWRRTLTPLEISGIYLAGATNGVGIAPPPPPVPVAALQLQQASGQWQLIWSGTGGALQASGDVSGTYTNVPSASSPYTISASSAQQIFYRLKY